MLAIAVLLALTSAQQAQSPAPDLSDPEVAHVAVTANSIDIDMAKLAQTHTTKAAVRQFAATMITDHTAVSQFLQTGATQARTSLEPLHGAAFDRAYMDREVAYHQAVLDAIDKLLIPTTENAEL